MENRPESSTQGTCVNTMGCSPYPCLYKAVSTEVRSLGIWSITNVRSWMTALSLSKIQQTRQTLFLAHLVMSLCNHALSVVCRCRCRRHRCRLHLRHQRLCRHQHLCTAVPVTALIIETSYLADICIYAPSLCT